MYKSNLLYVYPKVDSFALSYEKYIYNYAQSIKKSRILDVGCGYGNYTRFFSINENSVTGLDIQDIRVKKFRPYFKFVKYNGKIFPFQKETFDVITSFDVIEHVQDDMLFIKEIKRVLKPKGKILIATPNRQRLVNHILAILGKHPTYPILGKTKEVIHFREYTDTELLSLFLKQEFNHLWIDHFWFGLRTKINLGISYPLIRSLCQMLFLRNDKF
jgi:2-polyprenyl-3-methyl-5-hydroxy-6-metoxy-1,4-benzoquinol methylase